MRFVQHPTSTRALGAPKGWDQEQLECGALPITDRDVDGVAGMSSYWELDEVDISVLLGGGKIRLTIIGNSHPVVMIEAVPS